MFLPHRFNRFPRDRHTGTHGHGFTLIELMITVAIASIIAAFAVPSYLGSIKKTHRSEATSALLQLESAVIRYKSENNTFVGSADDDGTPLSTVFPSQAPIDGTPKLYDLTLTVTASTYTLTATPIAGTTMADDGAFTLNDAGVRTWNGETGWD